MRLAHISDLHVLDIDAKFYEFFNKRIIGGLNLMLKRKKEHDPKYVEALIEDLNNQDIDHLVITGDITNLALDSEFKRAKKILEGYKKQDSISIIPGNHDNYVKKAYKNKLFEKYFSSYLKSDVSVKNIFPFIKFLKDDIALIAFSSSIPSCLFCSAGKISKEQINQFEEVMKDDRLKNMKKIALIHHHVSDYSKIEKYFSGLRNKNEILDLLAKYNIEILLHGHRHTNGEYVVEHNGYKLKVLETAASARYSKNSSGSYSIYDIKDDKFIKTVRRLDYKNKKFI